MHAINEIVSGDMFLPGVALFVILAVVALLITVSRNYIKVAPNRAAIFFGRKYRLYDPETKQTKVVGFRVVSGGSKYRLPLLESVQQLDLNSMTIELSVDNVPNKDGVQVTVRGVATVKILSDESSLVAAAERFLGMDARDIRDVAYKNLEGHLRAIVGGLTVEDLINNRTIFQQRVLDEAGADLRKIGMGIDVMTIQGITDEGGYIEALGKKRTAEVVSEATIGKANAERDATQKRTTAEREAATTAADNEAQTAAAQRTRDVQRAKFDAEVQEQQATASQAGPLATARARLGVVQAEVEVERLKTEKEGGVALAQAELREKQLVAEVVRPAEAAQKKTILDAEAARQAAILKAQGEAEAIGILADAERKRREQEGLGAAAAIRATGEAQAAVVQATRLAEAEGVRKLAEAYAALDETGKSLQVLERVTEVLPQALEKVPAIMAEIARPLGQVDSVHIVDFGSGGNGGDSGGLGKMARIVPETLTQFVTMLQAMGMDPGALLKKAGVEINGGLLGNGGSPAPPVPGTPAS